MAEGRAWGLVLRVLFGWVLGFFIFRCGCFEGKEVPPPGWAPPGTPRPGEGSPNPQPWGRKKGACGGPLGEGCTLKSGCPGCPLPGPVRGCALSPAVPPGTGREAPARARGARGARGVSAESRSPAPGLHPAL